MSNNFWIVDKSHAINILASPLTFCPHKMSKYLPCNLYKKVTALVDALNVHYILSGWVARHHVSPNHLFPRKIWRCVYTTCITVMNPCKLSLCESKSHHAWRQCSSCHMLGDWTWTKLHTRGKGWRHDIQLFSALLTLYGGIHQSSAYYPHNVQILRILIYLVASIMSFCTNNWVVGY